MKWWQVKLINGLMLACLFLLLPSHLSAQPKKPFIWPVEGEVLTGFREQYWDQDGQKFRKHTGIDIKAGPGTRVKASASGRVSYIGISPTGGSPSEGKRAASGRPLRGQLSISIPGWTLVMHARTIPRSFTITIHSKHTPIPQNK